MNTQIWKAALAATMMMTTGCLFTGEDPTTVGKDEAATRMNADPNVLDYCALNGWYNDGECDVFCRQDDIDCEDDKDCREDDECGRDEFCKKAFGACDAEGECTATSTRVTADYAPVCGCDGQSYENASSASSSGVSVDHAGECDRRECYPQECGQEPDVQQCPNGDGPTLTCEPSGGGCDWVIGPCETDPFCGGFGGFECAPDEFCAFEANDGCGFDDGGSVCKPRPQDCPSVYDPVCGCDLEDYANACSANAAGVGVYAQGECEWPSVECAGPDRTQCGVGEYCELYACGEPEAGGECRTRETGGCPENYDPVCSCDGKTYGNRCEAAREGASIAYEGECGELPDRACGGFAGLACDARTEYCHYEERGCGFDDGQGVCRPRPDACDADYVPVCGCDGKTYGNECSANEAGMGIQYDGPCEG